MKVKIMSYTQNPEQLVASAAKLCYSNCNIEELFEKQTPEKVESFLQKLNSMGHESPVEHVSFSFGIEGISRSLTHQLVRHRIASYSQQSQRYVDMSDFKIITPTAILECKEAMVAFEETLYTIEKNYIKIKNALKKQWLCEAYNIDSKTIIDEEEFFKEMKNKDKELFRKFDKKANENARSILPNCAETKIVVTMNVRSLFNFFRHRCCYRAQDEIRKLAKEMLRLCRQVSFNLFKYAGPACFIGYCPEGDMQCDQFRNRIPTLKTLIHSHSTLKEIGNEHFETT